MIRSVNEVVSLNTYFWRSPCIMCPSHSLVHSINFLTILYFCFLQKQKFTHIGANHLVSICQRIGPILDKEIKPTVSGLNSLLGAGRQSLLRTVHDVCRKWFPVQDYSVRLNSRPLCEPVGFKCHNLGMYSWYLTCSTTDAHQSSAWRISFSHSFLFTDLIKYSRPALLRSGNGFTLIWCSQFFFFWG